MFGFFKFHRLHGILEEADISTASTGRIKFEVLDSSRQLFDPKHGGKENFKRLMEMLYEDNPACTRIKLLIAVHRIIGKQSVLAEQFIEHQPREYKGVKIKRRVDRSPLKQKSQKQQLNAKETLAKLEKIDRAEKLERSTHTNEVSPQPSRSKRYSIDEQIVYDDVNVYLLMYMVRPYEAYLLKLAAHYDIYEQCRNARLAKADVDFVLVWKLINMCKSLVPFRQVLTHIGRYYLSESRYIIDFLEMITRDLFYFYRVVEQHVAMALDTFSKLDVLQMENIIGVVEELPDINEALFEIFYGRYFYKVLRNVRSPKWVSLTSEQLDHMHRTLRLRTGKPVERRHSRHHSYTMTEKRQPRARNFEELDLSFGRNDQ